MSQHVGENLLWLCLLISLFIGPSQCFHPSHIRPLQISSQFFSRQKDHTKGYQYCRERDHLVGGILARTNENEFDKKNTSFFQPGKLRRYLRKSFFSVSVASSVLFGPFTPPKANAKFSYELQETPTHSIRPGMSRTQVDSVEKGELDIKAIESSNLQQQQQQSPSTSSAKQVKKKRFWGRKEKPSSYLYEDEDLDDGDDEIVVSDVIGSQADQSKAQQMQASSKKEFSYYNQGKSRALTVKVGLAIFVPTFGAQVLREHIRRKREEEYVKKGLEIQRAQKAEYFNVTSTSNDSDVEDELKDLKNKDGKSDDDGDDDDDDEDTDNEDDDDDEPEPPRRRGLPRRPPPSSPSGGSDPTGSDNRPSDEDLSRLNDLFKKS